MCVNYPQFNMAIGISKKINMQIETLKSLGFDVYYSEYLEDGIAICHDGEIIEKKIYKNKKLNGFLRRFRLLYECNHFLIGKHFNLGFIRWDPVDSLFLKVLYNLNRSCDKVIMDFHGYFPNYSGRGLKGKYTKITTNLNGHKMASYIDYGIVELKNTEVFGIRTLPTDTSIDVDNYQPHRYIGNSNELNLISVSNETAYHGYDRIIRGIYEYKKNDNSRTVKLHLVGKMTEKTKGLIDKYNLNNEVILYGYQSGNELQKIYEKCNIAVGPLAPHRVGGKQGTGIKTKEYFAVGIPYFYAGNELLVPDDYKYVLKLKANDSAIDINEIIDFYDSIKEDSKIVDEMRNFARNNYSCKKTFITVLNEIGLM